MLPARPIFQGLGATTSLVAAAVCVSVLTVAGMKVAPSAEGPAANPIEMILSPLRAAPSLSSGLPTGLLGTFASAQVATPASTGAHREVGSPRPRAGTRAPKPQQRPGDRKPAPTPPVSTPAPPALPTTPATPPPAAPGRGNAGGEAGKGGRSPEKQKDSTKPQKSQDRSPGAADKNGGPKAGKTGKRGQGSATSAGTDRALEKPPVGPAVPGGLKARGHDERPTAPGHNAARAGGASDDRRRSGLVE